MATEKTVTEATADASTDLAEYPGRTLGIVAVVLAFFVQLPALVMGIIAWMWSNKAGHNNVPAKVAVAVSASLLVVGLVALVAWIALMWSLAGEFGPGYNPYWGMHR